MEDDRFYEVAREGVDISIDIPGREIVVGEGEGEKKFRFVFSKIEEELLMNRGVTNAYRRYGKGIWEKLTADEEEEKNGTAVAHVGSVDSRLEW